MSIFNNIVGSTKQTNSLRKFFYIIGFLWLIASFVTLVSTLSLERKSISVRGTVVSYYKENCFGAPANTVYPYFAYLPVYSFNLAPNSESVTYIASCNKDYDYSRLVYLPPIGSTVTLRVINHPFKPTLLVAGPNELLIGNLGR